jgi:Cu(I)/Ag(I) efflux system membrane fusion protein
MTFSPRSRLAAGAAAIAIVAGLGGYGLASLKTSRPSAPTPASPAQPGQKVLYWYDPMVPTQHFDKPGKSPMAMDMIPRYADGASAAAVGVTIDPAALQNLGVRLARVERGDFAQILDATGVLDFNQRDVAIVQARAAGFVERVYARAPGDVVRAGAPIADLLVPSWGGAQGEYLAVRATGDRRLEAAARQRLRLLGMPDGLIDQVAESGRTHGVVTITTPVGGAIQTLDVRQGMSVNMGQNLAQVNGLSTVWLNAAAPEAQGGQVRVGESARAELAAFPGETFTGRVTAVLPTADVNSRTLTVRVELPNRDDRLRPGMFATVHISGQANAALFIPSEAVIRTGKRVLVMLAAPGGRFQPVEVQPGREEGDRTEILAGLSEGDKVVASGQFLIDSEASLADLQVRPLSAAAAPAAASVALNETRGRIEALSGDQITISHEAVASIGWPAMTMTFRLESPTLGKGLKVGDRVAFGFEQTPNGPVVRRLARAGAAR